MLEGSSPSLRETQANSARGFYRGKGIGIQAGAEKGRHRRSRGQKMKMGISQGGDSLWESHNCAKVWEQVGEGEEGGCALPQGGPHQRHSRKCTKS